MLSAFGPLRSKEITNEDTGPLVCHLWANANILDVRWSLVVTSGMNNFDARFIIRSWMKISVKQTNNKPPARQKTFRANSYHQAVAARFCRYGMIEGFRSLGRITGFEMIARFNRPLKQKGNSPTERKRTLCPSHWPAPALLQTFYPSSWIGHVYVSLSKSPPTRELNLLAFHIISESSESANLNSGEPQNLCPVKIEYPAGVTLSTSLKRSFWKTKSKTEFSVWNQIIVLTIRPSCHAFINYIGLVLIIYSPNQIPP